MKARRTHTTNTNVAYPGDPSRDLPARTEQTDEGRAIFSVWALSPSERAAIATGANLELGVWGNLFPPVSLSVTRELVLPINPDKPEPPADDATILWLEFRRELVVDLVELLSNLDGGACLRTGSRARLEALNELLVEYLPHLAPIADDEAPADA